ncbi:DNA helicase, partial [Tanacetum coccineum]
FSNRELEFVFVGILLNYERNFGNVSKRQQSARRFYNNSEPYDGDCGMIVGGSTFGSSNVPRFLPDDRYDCLFRQSGSVETQGESSSAVVRRNVSLTTDLPGPVGFSPTDHHSLFLSGYRGGPAILDFETSTALMSSMNGGNHPANLSSNSPCTSKEGFPLPLTKQQKKGFGSQKGVTNINEQHSVSVDAQACDALGLFRDDKEWDIAMKEACFSSTAFQLRSLFAQILIFCDVADPIKLWKTYWRVSSDDEIPEEGCITDLQIPGIFIILLDPEFEGNREMMEEKSYDRDELAAEESDLYLGTLKDLFGGKSIILGGNFRQTLPVKKGASKLKIVASSIAESQLWHHFKVCILKENMRLAQPGKSQEELSLTQAFVEWLLDIATMTLNCISDLAPGAKNKILEAKVYRKWIVKKPKKPALLDYCCILIDREGNAIQANMGKADIGEYFSSLLQEDSIQNIKVHVCSNKVMDDKWLKVSERKRLIKCPRPVIFVLDSCKVSEYGGILQLLATSATHYYLNLEIPELEKLFARRPALFSCSTTYNPSYCDMGIIDFYFDDIPGQPLQDNRKDACQHSREQPAILFRYIYTRNIIPANDREAHSVTQTLEVKNLHTFGCFRYASNLQFADRAHKQVILIMKPEENCTKLQFLLPETTSLSGDTAIVRLQHH